MKFNLNPLTLNTYCHWISILNWTTLLNWALLNWTSRLNWTLQGCPAKREAGVLNYMIFFSRYPGMPSFNGSLSICVLQRKGLQEFRLDVYCKEGLLQSISYRYSAGIALQRIASLSYRYSALIALICFPLVSLLCSHMHPFSIVRLL